jgi:hypothetical protein
MDPEPRAEGGPFPRAEGGAAHSAYSPHSGRDEAEGLPVTFSRPGTKVAVLMAPLIVLALLLVAALNPAVYWWARILFGLLVAAVAAVLGRIMIIAISARPDRLVIRNLRNTHRIPWAAISGIYETPPPPPEVYRANPLYRRQIDLFVGLTDGSVISATLYDHQLFPDDHSGRAEAIDRLNRLRLRLSPPTGGQSSVADSGPDLLS